MSSDSLPEAYGCRKCNIVFSMARITCPRCGTLNIYEVVWSKKQKKYIFRVEKTQGEAGLQGPASPEEQ